MKYVLLAYTRMAAWNTMDPTDPDFIAACEFYGRMTEELTASGEFVTAEGLAHPGEARVVRRNEDGPGATDGPFAEAKEVLASFVIVDVASRERAVEIAGRVAEAVGDTIEVRRIGSGPEDSMPGA